MNLVYKEEVKNIKDEWSAYIVERLQEKLEKDGKSDEMILNCQVVISADMEYEKVKEEDIMIMGRYIFNENGDINEIEIYWRHFEAMHPKMNKLVILAIIEVLAHEYRHCFQREYYTYFEQKSERYKSAIEGDADDFAKQMHMEAQEHYRRNG